MKNTLFLKAVTNEGTNYIVGMHNTSFMDQKFFDKFENKDKNMIPVDIKAMQADWILSNKGFEFLNTLS